MIGGELWRRQRFFMDCSAGIRKEVYNTHIVLRLHVFVILFRSIDLSLALRFLIKPRTEIKMISKKLKDILLKIMKKKISGY